MLQRAVSSTTTCRLLAALMAAALIALGSCTRSTEQETPTAELLWPPGGSAPPPGAQPAAGQDGAGAVQGGPPAGGSAAAQPAAPKQIHPLLDEAGDAVIAESGADALSTAAPRVAEAMRTALAGAGEAADLPVLTIDYPLDQSIIPPEIVPATFLWHEPSEQADTWVIDVGVGNGAGRLLVLAPGAAAPSGRIDPACVSPTNEVYQPTPYQASAKSWTPSPAVWEAIKQRSAGAAVEVAIVGFHSGSPAKPLSRGRMTLTTSKDPVGAVIFYRDVPLAPSRTEQGVIRPLGDDALLQIAWRLRDLSQPESRQLLTAVPTCSNCHSFAADGKTMGMDLDGPRGDKGAYVIAPIVKEMAIERKDVISWNSFKDQPKDHKTIGFLSQISPDGQYVVTTLNEDLYVCNFLDYRFLQVFYPTRGILAYYARATGEMKALPGADDPEYVHCDAVWSPKGDYLVFARAKAMAPYPASGVLPKHANDPAETQIRYDLYRIPFNGGRGGAPEPIAGASNNGASNTFPKISPDGKWIVFVRCRNGQLMRPDSKLWIVPTAGGEARLMQCNTWRMNSWHSFSPNGRWMVFSSKANTPYTEMHLTHIDDEGNDSPPILIPNATAANRAVNIPEFVNIPYDGLVNISVPAVQYLRDGFRGVQLARKGMLDEAMKLFEKAIESRPDYLEGRVNAAVVLLEQGRLDEAMASLDEVLKLDPQRWDALGALGVVLWRKGKLDEAVGRFEAALKIKPDYLDARANLGKVFAEQGKLEQATAHFLAALSIDPKDALSHLDLGEVLLRRGRFVEAAEHFRKCLEINPRFTAAQRLLAAALDAQRRPAASAAQSRNAAGANPSRRPGQP